MTKIVRTAEVVLIAAEVAISTGGAIQTASDACAGTTTISRLIVSALAGDADSRGSAVLAAIDERDASGACGSVHYVSSRAVVASGRGTFTAPFKEAETRLTNKASSEIHSNLTLQARS